MKIKIWGDFPLPLLAANKGISRIIVEMDSTTSVNLIQAVQLAGVGDFHPLASLLQPPVWIGDLLFDDILRISRNRLVCTSSIV
ncbi:hypothetical protein DVH24_001805 [Malus domestica]|uniref:Uncharacterized protein n=1 Tax=Malus domestica TaxID=3750 RepID=A0A498I8H2_MALDO|nr:hypothetical protein DVH24_001805 [Malus domestica]